MSVANFPVLTFSQNLVRREESMSDLTKCTRVALKKRFYDGLKLIDSQGLRFDVIGAKKIRLLPPKPQFGHILDYMTGNFRYQVELLFAPGTPVHISLEEVKKLIFDSFKKEKYSWQAMIDFDEFRDKVAAAKSLDELFAVFNEYHV